MVEINNELCLSCQEAAGLIGVSVQTIWRYTKTQNPNRKIRHYINENNSYRCKIYVPKSEVLRFSYEIQPTFIGGPGRPQGSHDKKRRKNKNIDVYRSIFFY